MTTFKLNIKLFIFIIIWKFFQVLEEYEKTIKSIEKLEKAISNPQEQMEDLRNEMNEKKGRWIPQVLSLVTRINSNFTNFFSHMKCVGEVSLEEPDDKVYLATI